MTASTLVLRSGIGVGNSDVTGIVLHGLYPGTPIPPTPGTGVKPRWFSLDPTPVYQTQGALAGPGIRAHSIGPTRDRRG